MARIRSIKPEFFTSEQVVSCSPTARLLFVGMWCFCDDAGIHPASEKRLKMEVLPGDKISERQIGKHVQELIDAGLLTLFSAEAKSWWAVTGWKHQRIDKPNFRYPTPNIRRDFDESSKNGHGVIDDSSPPEGSGVEGSGEYPPIPPCGGGCEFFI